MALVGAHPELRVHRGAIVVVTVANFHVQVRALGDAGHAHQPEHVPGLDSLPDIHQHL